MLKTFVNIGKKQHFRTSKKFTWHEKLNEKKRHPQHFEIYRAILSKYMITLAVRRHLYICNKLADLISDKRNFVGTTCCFGDFCCNSVGLLPIFDDEEEDGGMDVSF